MKTVSFPLVCCCSFALISLWFSGLSGVSGSTLLWKFGTYIISFSLSRAQFAFLLSFSSSPSQVRTIKITPHLTATVLNFSFLRIYSSSFIPYLPLFSLPPASSAIYFFQPYFLGLFECVTAHETGRRRGQKNGTNDTRGEGTHRCKHADGKRKER